MNRLYYGDNLGVLRDYIDDESVDLIYLDPPFNSRRSFNILFSDDDSRDSPAQIQAFDDTWHWDDSAERNFRELVGDRHSLTDVPEKLSNLMASLCRFLGRNDTMAYLSMMALRLVELHRVLKQTGALYLHCDPTASHYLRCILDGIFGPQFFRSEVVWKRTGSHNSAKRYGPVHDTIFYYVKSDATIFRPTTKAHSPKYLKKFSKIDKQTKQRFQDVTLTGPGVRAGASGQPWRGVDPTTKGRHWQPASYVYGKYTSLTGDDLAAYPFLDRLDRLDDAGLIYWTRNGTPRYKQFLDDAEGAPLQDVWTDIDAVNSQAAERIGYPTQKPVALMERIVEASSEPGATILDPFCGCGTTIEAAERLGRTWIGIDITHLALKTIRERVAKVFGPLVYSVGGNPADADSARVLAKENWHQFQDWSVRFVEGRAVGGTKKSKKGGDRGIDGELFYRSGPDDTKHRVVISVKGGKKVGPAMVRELRGTTERERCAIGVLITATPSTKEMRTDAARAGSISVGGRLYPRIQILTVDDLFNAQRVEHPGDNITEGTNPPPEQMLLFDQVKRGVLKTNVQLSMPRLVRGGTRPKRRKKASGTGTDED